MEFLEKHKVAIGVATAAIVVVVVLWLTGTFSSSDSQGEKSRRGGGQSGGGGGQSGGDEEDEEEDGSCTQYGACICEDATPPYKGYAVGLFKLDDPTHKIVKVKMASADGSSDVDGYLDTACPKTEKKEDGITYGKDGASAFPCPQTFTLAGVGKIHGWGPQANGAPPAGYPDEGNAC